MKAALCSGFTGTKAIDSTLSVGEYAKPKLDPKQKNRMLIKVLACSISPGDVRTIVGDGSAVRTPKSWPYVPGHDVCGVIEELPPDCADFKVGDCIVTNSNQAMLANGLAEYALVEVAHAAIKPDNVSVTDAACVPTSALRAMVTAESRVKKGDRILVIGAGGGFGTLLVQLAKHQGAAYIAAISTQKELLLSLGADEVFDYNQVDWWDLQQFKEDKFDSIFDCVSNPGYKQSGSVLKSSGYHYGVTLDNNRIVIHHYHQILTRLMLPYGWRYLASRLNPFRPKFTLLVFEGTRDQMQRAIKLVSDGTLKIVLHEDRIFEFNEEQVKEAFRLSASMHAHGKLVIKIAE